MNRFLIIVLFALTACGGENSVEPEATETKTEKKVRTERLGKPRAGKMVTEAQRQQVQMLISTSKMAMDSIDAAYKSVRTSSKLLKLTVEERETVNEALQGL